MASHTPSPGGARLLRAASILPDRLWELQMALRRLDRDLAESLDLPESHWHALLALSGEGPLPVTGLGDTLHLEKSTASRLADAVVEEGLARKRPSFTDGRSVVLQLTEEGRRLTRRGLNRRTEIWMAVLGGAPVSLAEGEKGPWGKGAEESLRTLLDLL